MLESFFGTLRTTRFTPSQNAIISQSISLSFLQQTNTLPQFQRTDQQQYSREMKHLKAYLTHLTLIPYNTLINHIPELFILSHSHMMKNSSPLELETKESRYISLVGKMEERLFLVRCLAIQSQQCPSLLVLIRLIKKLAKQFI